MEDVLERREISHYSRFLEKEMHVLIYGHSGVPVIGLPTQDSKCHNFEDFHFTDEISDYIDQGKIQLFCVDSVDEESWSDESIENSWRSARQESYYHYLVDEVVPFVRDQNQHGLPLLVGLSMGAIHAAILFFRRPELFAGMLSLSGVYDSSYFYHGWMDPTLYDNSVEAFLPNMPLNHPYIKIYNTKKIIFCVGQGDWEWDGVRTLRNLSGILRSKGINAWTDFWGYDVNHDWPWWKKQIRYFLPYLLGEDKI